MNLAVPPIVVRPAAGGKQDRKFYTGMSIAMLLAVLIGFGPTYYFRIAAGQTPHTISNNPITPLLSLHAVLFTSWVLLFIVQTSLVATYRVKLHRSLGYAGAALAAGMVVVGTLTAIAGARTGTAPPGLTPQQFLIIPLADMATFAVFVIAAIWFRNNKDIHKRLMLLAYVCIVAAATARWPGVLPLGPLVFYALAFSFGMAGVLYDWRFRGTVHPVYKWGFSLLILSVPLRLAVSSTSAWNAFADMLIR